jgi:GTPase
MTQKCGFVAIVGRPNVGKSTLLNHLLGQKVSITSRKPQTTRNQILGIFTEDGMQIVFVDTPGLHIKEDRAINRFMNRAASSSLQDVNAILFVVDGTAWTEDDEMVLNKVRKEDAPVYLLINKIDKIKDKESLLPHLQALSEKHQFDEVFPISALKETNLKPLFEKIQTNIPEGVHFFPEDYITDRSERFLAAEIVREKVMRSLGDELPYSAAVEIERFQVNEKGVLLINAIILVERKGQKAIVIGKQGSRLKQIGKDARHDMESLFEKKIFLEIWVKVRDGWADDERALKSLGYYND